MKTAYHYDHKTLIYAGSSQVHKLAGYDEYILPQLSTWIPKPDFNQDIEQAKFNPKTQQWSIESKPVETTAYNKKTKEQKVFDDVSLVPEEYTTKAPLTRWDEWKNDNWVTNESKKLAHEEHEWVKAQLSWYDSKLIYASRGDTSRAEGYTKDQLDKYAIALCDYTSVDKDGNITVNGDARPSI